MMKRVTVCVALAISLLAMTATASAQSLPLTVSLGGYTVSIPEDWVAELVPNSGLGLVSDATLLDALDSSDAELNPGDLAVLIADMAELEPMLGSADSAQALMETFVGFLSPGSEIAEVNGLPFEAYVAQADADNFPGGQALLYSLDLEGYLVLAVVVSGGTLSEARPLAESILATLSYEAPPPPEPVGSLSYGDAVTGEISGEASTQLWTFEGEAGDRVTITMIAAEGSSLDSTLSLYTQEDYDNQDGAIAFNDDAISSDVGGFNSQIEAAELFEDGTYIIEASSFGSSGGAYTLSLALASDAEATAEPRPTAAASTGGGEIAYGDTVTGAIDDEGTNSELWTFTGQAGDVVTITMIADDTDEVDPRLYLYLSPDVSSFDVIVENDDAEDSSVGRLNSQIFEFELPEDGEYVIEATQFGFGAGTYSLTLETAAAASTDETGGGKPDVAQSGDEVRQWAADASGSSQYGTESWSFLQATGEPNTEACGDISSAWASATSNGKDDLSLTYEVPVLPSQISIYQTYNPGSIIRVEVSNSSTEETAELFNSADEPGNTDCPGVFVLEVEAIDFPIDTVTIYLDQTIGGGWNEIDAVELVGTVP
jgi:hypothetical protein